MPLLHIAHPLALGHPRPHPVVQAEPARQAGDPQRRRHRRQRLRVAQHRPPVPVQQASLRAVAHDAVHVGVEVEVPAQRRAPRGRPHPRVAPLRARHAAERARRLVAVVVRLPHGAQAQAVGAGGGDVEVAAEAAGAVPRVGRRAPVADVVGREEDDGGVGVRAEERRDGREGRVPRDAAVEAPGLDGADAVVGGGAEGLAVGGLLVVEERILVGRGFVGVGRLGPVVVFHVGRVEVRVRRGVV